jgi:hypothetical protein
MQRVMRYDTQPFPFGTRLQHRIQQRTQRLRVHPVGGGHGGTDVVPVHLDHARPRLVVVGPQDENDSPGFGDEELDEHNPVTQV